MRRLVLILGLLVVVAYAATGVYQVRPGERAVVRRFGRVMDQTEAPGLHFSLPWGLDRVDKVAVDEQRQINVGYVPSDQPVTVVAPAGQVVTGDNHLIDLRVAVYYRVDYESPNGVVQFVVNQDRLEDVLARAAEVALATTLAGQKVDAVLLGQARNLEAQLQRRLIATVREYDLGVAIESVNLQYVQPPTELAEVFRDVNRARTQKEIAVREAMTAKQTEVSVARSETRRLLTDADVAAHDRVSRAKVEAGNFLALWKNQQASGDNGANALLTYYLKEMQAVMSRFQVRISDPKVDQTIFLPLPDK